MDIERQFWHGESFWYRTFGKMGFVERVWFFLTLGIMVFGGFYIGFWIASQKEVPIDVPYVTATSYIESKEQALAAAKNYLGDDGKLTIMLLGCDIRDDDVGRSDTLMVAFVDLETPTVDLLSIPRDTYVSIGGNKGKTKINHAFAYGGIPLTQKTVEEFIGVDIDRYIQVDFQGFTKIVDAMGGVEMDVERRMYRPSDNIDLQPGLQTLNGTQALGYVRWRSDGLGDIGRVGRQQNFINAVADQFLTFGNIFKIPKIVSIIQENVHTNLSAQDVMSLAEIFKGATDNQMRTEMVPGTDDYINGISYWIPNTNELNALVQEMLTEGVATPKADTPATATE